MLHSSQTCCLVASSRIIELWGVWRLMGSEGKGRGLQGLDWLFHTLPMASTRFLDDGTHWDVGAYRALGFVVLRGCRLVSLLQRNCCLQPRACVITTATVMLFTDKMLMVVIYDLYPGHDPAAPCGHTAFLSVCRGGWQVFCSVYPFSGIRCWFWMHEALLCVSCCGGCLVGCPKGW